MTPSIQILFHPKAAHTYQAYKFDAEIHFRPEIYLAGSYKIKRVRVFVYTLLISHREKELPVAMLLQASIL
jgi:hypothetical protein